MANINFNPRNYFYDFLDYTCDWSIYFYFTLPSYMEMYDEMGVVN